MNFSEMLLQWYPNHKRDLPWRDTNNPYYIWLSEIILQQTRVKQGLPYYEAFITRFPTIQDMAAATEEEVMRTWQGLGYYSRARNMHTTAKYIAHELQGNLPTNKAEWLKLKGVGEYTASAIASFGFGERVSVVDGNVFRVLARFFGIEDDISSIKGAKIFQALAQTLLPAQDERVSTYNQAIMEFGALQCTPQKPDCMYCPLQASCVAHGTGRQGELPFKSLKTSQKERFFNYTILKHAENIAMRKREAGDIWTGLYDFIWEDAAGRQGEVPLCLDDLKNNKHYFRLLPAYAPVKHILTHQTLFISFWVAVLPENLPPPCLPEGYAWYTPEKVQNLPKPIVIAQFLEKNGL